MGYYIADTLTDIRINPASAHRAFIYGTVNDTPGIGLARTDWVIAYSLDDVKGPVPYDPTYLTGDLMISRKRGTLWPFLRARARLITGPGDYGEDWVYYDYRNELSVSLRPGLGFVRGNWEGVLSLGCGLGRDTAVERGIFYYGYLPPTYKRSRRGNESGFAIETAHRLRFGRNEDLSWVGILSVQRLDSSARDSTMYTIYDSLNHRAFEIVRWESRSSAPDYDWPHIFLDSWGLGLSLYERFRLDMLKKSCWSCDPLDPFSYRFEMFYLF